MKYLHLDRRMLSAFLAGILLAGCGASGQFSAPAAQTGLGNARSEGLWLPHRPASKRAPFKAFSEDLIGSAVTGCFEGVTSNFTASGTATGPYPGTFTASGDYHVSRGGGAWFAETFTIYSGTLEVSGEIPYGGDPSPPVFACEKFGPITWPYTSNYGSGYAKITIRKRTESFHERLSGL